MILMCSLANFDNSAKAIIIYMVFLGLKFPSLLLQLPNQCFNIDLPNFTSTSCASCFDVRVSSPSIE